MKCIKVMLNTLFIYFYTRRTWQRITNDPEPNPSVSKFLRNHFWLVGLSTNTIQLLRLAISVCNSLYTPEKIINSCPWQNCYNRKASRKQSSSVIRIAGLSFLLRIRYCSSKILNHTQMRECTVTTNTFNNFF